MEKSSLKQSSHARRCVRTYQTRPRVVSANELGLQAYANLYGRIEHTLFKDISSGKDAYQLKSSYLKKFGITARQFKACRVSLEGKIASVQEQRKNRITDLNEAIKVLEKRIPKIKDRSIQHQKKRRLHKLKQELLKLTKSHKVPLCFGSRKLFRAQFNLEANGYNSLKEWKTDWHNARNNEIFFLGSKDETGGNQSLTATLEPDNTLTLRIRLPDALIPQHGKYLTIPHVHFSYGHKEIVASLMDCCQRQLLSQAKDGSYKNHGQALTYRFKRDKKGWRLFVTTTLPKPPLYWTKFAF